MRRIIGDTLGRIWEQYVCIAPRHVRYIAAFLAVVLLALCAFYPSQALARPLSASARPLGSGTSKTYQPPVVAAAVRISHHLIFVGDSLTEGAFALDAAHSYAVL